MNCSRGCAAGYSPDCAVDTGVDSGIFRGAPLRIKGIAREGGELIALGDR